MCELLVFVKDKAKTGKLAVDSRLPKAGDVVVIRPDGHAWGEGELGGPNWTKPIFDTYAQDISVTMLDGFDVTQVNSQAMLYRYGSYTVGSTVPNPASLDMGSWLNTAPLVLLDNDDGLPAHFSSFKFTGQVVSFTRYTRVVREHKVVPISEHPHGNHSFWRVLKLPNVTEERVSHLLTPEPDVDETKPSPYLQNRMWHFDKDKIPAGPLLDHWNDDARTQGFISLPHTATQVDDIVSRRLPIAFTPP